jgi:hypothetical protein
MLESVFEIKLIQPVISQSVLSSREIRQMIVSNTYLSGLNNKSFIKIIIEFFQAGFW